MFMWIEIYRCKTFTIIYGFFYSLNFYCLNTKIAKFTFRIILILPNYACMGMQVGICVYVLYVCLYVCVLMSMWVCTYI